MIEKFTKYKREILKEGMNSNPSIYLLQSIGEYVMSIMDGYKGNLKNGRDPLKADPYRVFHDADCFVADLTEIQHDYNKKLKRYKPEWRKRGHSLSQILDDAIEVIIVHGE